MALNITTPLGDYPGRNGGFPISLHYNSKLWEVKSSYCVDAGANPIVRTEKHEIIYSANSWSGWASSLRVPYVIPGNTEGYVVRFYQNATYYGPDHAQPTGACPLINMLACSDPGAGCIAYPWEYFIDKVRLYMPGGTSQELRASDSATPYPYQPGTIYKAVDGSGTRYDLSNQTIYLSDGSQYRLNTTAGAEYIDRNGNKLNWDRNAQQWTDTVGRVFTDPLNASSQWSLPGIGGNNLNYTFVWSGLRNDATGQTVLTNPNNPADPNTWNPGLGVNPLKYMAPHNEDITQFFSDHLFNLESSTAEHNNFVVQNSSNRHNPYVLHQIMLPNNQKYVFTYNIYGEINKVILPTGGYKRYEYGYIPPISMEPNANMYTQVNRGVVKMWESTKGDGTDEQLWQFTVTANGGTGYSIKTTAPDGTYVVRAIIQVAPPNDTFGFAVGGGDILAGRVDSETSYDASGNKLHGKSYTWGVDNGPTTPQYVAPGQPIPVQQASRNPRLMAEINYLYRPDGNMVATKVEYQYDAALNVVSITHYDNVAVPQGTTQLPPLTPLRIDEVIYLVYDATAELPSGVTFGDYVNRNLIRLPSKVLTMDGVRNVLAATEYKYDEAAYLAANYSTGVLNWTAPSLARGNVTTVRQWKNYDPAIGNVQSWTATAGSWQYNNQWSDNNWVEAHSWYDQCGNVVKIRDPKGNDATFDYTDNFSDQTNRNTYAFLKSTTSPNPGSTYGGNQSLVSTSTYDFSSGKVVSTLDPNLKTTTFEYNDPLDRLTRVVRPSGGGETVYQYGDTVGSLFLLTQTRQSSFPNVWLEDYALFDGLGRATRSAHKEASGFSVRDTRYDALGRVSQVSNPEIVAAYNTALPGSAVWTTTTYDALSRVTQVTTPDNASVKTTYLGNQVTVEDQAGRKRSSITDGLGRLIQVNEAPNDSAYNYQTNYTYDTLGNLIRVRQGGFPTGGSPDPTVQFRRFYYDSLSRLVYANNPEQIATIAFDPPSEAGTMWTMKYEYDDNGNLFKRTDARGVLTTYGYDALNRNTTVDYSDTSIAGPDIKRFYDTATNGKGRLQRVESYLISSQNSSRVDSQTIINSYDNLGRVTSQTQGFRKPDSTWQNFTATRTYDLASRVLMQNYPSGANFEHNYGTGGRTNFVQGALGGQGYSLYSSGMIYNAAGQMTEEVFGTSPAPIYHTARYNNRFQMYEVNAGTFNDVNNSASSAYWNRGRLRFFYNQAALNAEDPSLAGTDNNGNVLRQEHWVPTATQTNQINAALSNVTQYAMPMRDDYFYDPINRITKVEGRQQTASAYPGQGALQPIYQQAYSYDKFGNRKLDQAQTWGTGINGTQAAQIYDIDKPTNRLAGATYDRAGNLRANPGVALKNEDRGYDAENRMTSAKMGGATSYYVYDGDGRRVRRILPTGEFWQVYGIDGELLAEYQWNGTTASLKKEYGYRDGQLLVVADPTEINANKRVQWLIADHLGTPRMVVDKTGSLSGVTRHDYLPFGEELVVGMGGTGNPPSPTLVRSADLGYQQVDSVRQKFTGKERDYETGLDYFGARFFSSLQGRYTSPDDFLNDTHPVDPAGWNLYAYVRNNPLAYVDPDGEEVYSTNLSEDQKKQLINDWKNKTGYKNIYFDKNNKLTIDTKAGFKGGSATARRELLAAVDSSSKIFNLRAVTGAEAKEVGFADNQKTGTNTISDSKGNRTADVYETRIDFADFKQLQGDGDAKKAFSIGLVAIHEFEHGLHAGGVTGSDNPRLPGFPGWLEVAYINPIRAELGLAKRYEYSGIEQKSGKNAGYTELTFMKGGKAKILRWQYSVIGGVKK